MGIVTVTVALMFLWLALLTNSSATTLVSKVVLRGKYTYIKLKILN